MGSQGGRRRGDAELLELDRVEELDAERVRDVEPGALRDLLLPFASLKVGTAWRREDRERETRVRDTAPPNAVVASSGAP
jgi:hypothetical protein